MFNKLAKKYNTDDTLLKFYFFILLILLLPIIFTWKSFLNLDFTYTGQIGDTIGGTMGPFASLLGSWLVYKSFKAQMDANNLIQDGINEQKEAKQLEILNSQLEIIKTNLNELSLGLIDMDFDYSFKGRDVINQFIRFIWPQINNNEIGLNIYDLYEVKKLYRLFDSILYFMDNTNAFNFKSLLYFHTRGKFLDFFDVELRTDLIELNKRLKENPQINGNCSIMVFSAKIEEVLRRFDDFRR
jgi:hypothetical protein